MKLQINASEIAELHPIMKINAFQIVQLPRRRPHADTVFLRLTRGLTREIVAFGINTKIGIKAKFNHKFAHGKYY